MEFSKYLQTLQMFSILHVNTAELADQLVASKCSQNLKSIRLMKRSLETGSLLADVVLKVSN